MDPWAAYGPVGCTVRPKFQGWVNGGSGHLCRHRSQVINGLPGLPPLRTVPGCLETELGRSPPPRSLDPDKRRKRQVREPDITAANRGPDHRKGW